MIILVTAIIVVLGGIAWVAAQERKHKRKMSVVKARNEWKV